MSYQQYGISPELVERVKTKMKNPLVKERIKQILEGVTKGDLQDPTKVKKLLARTEKALREKLTERQKGNIVNFILEQRIDPQNTFHLIRLWSMFR